MRLGTPGVQFQYSFSVSAGVEDTVVWPGNVTVHNEAPNWAPNGQYLMFFRDPGGQSGGKLYMVDITGRVEVPVPTPAFASDPTWSPLLSGQR